MNTSRNRVLLREQGEVGEGMLGTYRCLNYINSIEISHNYCARMLIVS